VELYLHGVMLSFKKALAQLFFTLSHTYALPFSYTTKIWINFSSFHECHMPRPSSFSVLLLLPFSWSQIFSTAPCYQTSSVCVSLYFQWHIGKLRMCTRLVRASGGPTFSLCLRKLKVLERVYCVVIW
jgi:hypothetical protein